MKQQNRATSSHLPLPSHILPIATDAVCTDTTNTILLATSSSYDRFTIPAQSMGSTSMSNSISIANSNSKTPSSSPKGVEGGPGKNANGGRILCCDRRSFFHNFRPKLFILSSIRVSILQAAQVLSTFLTDQLEHEANLDEKLESNEISHLEYESSLLSFEEEEWNKRWKALLYTNKIWLAIGKFHLLTFLMRCYEGIIWNSGMVSLECMDMLTKDTFLSALRKAARLKEHQGIQKSARTSRNRQYSYRERKNQYFQIESVTGGGDSGDSGENISGLKNSTATTLSSSNSNQEVKSSFELGIQMFSTCLYANAISFFADLTVQQCILAYGYYKFFWSKQRQRKLAILKERHREYEELKLKDSYEEDLNQARSESKEEEICVREETDEGTEDREEVEKKISSDASITPLWVENEQAILMLSFFRRSIQAFFAKGVGLNVASFGGAVGSMIYPGWGTLFGTQIGDAVFGALMED